MRIRMGLVLAALATCITTARAENGWSVYGSDWDAGSWGNAPGVGTRLLIELAPYLDLDVKGTWYSEMDITQGAAKAAANVAPVDVGLVLSKDLAQSVAIYAGAGVSYYILNGNIFEKDVRVSGFSSNNSWGGYGLGGLEITLARNLDEINADRLTFYAEAFYRYAPMKSVTVDNGSTFNADDNLSGPGANAGLMLRW